MSKQDSPQDSQVQVASIKENEKCETEKEPDKETAHTTAIEHACWDENRGRGNSRIHKQKHEQETYNGKDEELFRSRRS